LLKTVSPGFSLNRQIANSVSSLGAALAIERISSFTANLLAARIAGAEVFGKYSLMINTAMNVASYAGAGIGQTATRFGGGYTRGTEGYRQMVKLLVLFTLASITLAAAILSGVAQPLAKFVMNNTVLAPLLRLAALSAGVMLAAESVRGFLVGQRQYRLLVMLAICCAGGWIIGLPLAARFGPRAMLVAHASSLGIGVVGSIALAKRRRLWTWRAATVAPELPSARLFAQFGLVQMLQGFCMNASGLWMTTLMARSDTSLIQLGFFAVASQIRNMVGFGPSLLGQTALSLLTDEAGSEYGSAEVVLTRSTFLASLLSIVFAGVSILAVHVAVAFFYGTSFAGAETAAIFGIGTALVHMSSAPAAARLSIVSVRVAGIITAFWATMVALAAFLSSPNVDAATAMKIYFLAHCVSAFAVAVMLWLSRSLPRATLTLTLVYLGSGGAMVTLGLWRMSGPTGAQLGPYFLLILLAVLLAVLLPAGARLGYIPSRISLRHLKETFTF
jgi:O-antigen/teichoic acid export membrane protein